MIQHLGIRDWNFLRILTCLLVLSVAVSCRWISAAEKGEAKTSLQSTTSPRITHLPPISAADRRGPETRFPNVPRLAQRIAPHEDLIKKESQSVASGGKQEPPLLAHTPTLISPLSPQTAIRERLPTKYPDTGYPDTGLLPRQLTADRPAADDTAVAVIPDWQEPEALLERLQELSGNGATGHWARQTDRTVRRLGPAVSQGSEEVMAIVRELDELAQQVHPLAKTVKDHQLARKLVRAGHALARRLDIWRHLMVLGTSTPSIAARPSADQRRLALTLADIDSATANSPYGEAWRKYLLVDALREWSARRDTAREEHRLPRDLALRALRRLTETQTNALQRQFLSSEPVTALRAELQRWAVEPVESAGLLAHLERYEQTGLQSDAKRLAADRLGLELAAGDTRRRLAERIDARYRNANLRIAVTEQLVNRLVPQRDPEYAKVHDTVQGVPVRGNSVTLSRVSMQLVPDQYHVKMALQVAGEVSSRTASTSGPATFFNNGWVEYLARKPLQVDLDGVHLSPTEVDVLSNTRLRDVRTKLDDIPLIGLFAQDVARRQHGQRRAAADREVKQKVVARVRQRVDSEAEARFGKVSEQLKQRVLVPVRALDLEPTVLHAQTTPQRFILRLRLAGKDQLASHTPRPQAPGDSLASFQAHESAMNNALGRLALDGKTFTLPELTRHVADRLNTNELWETAPDQEDVAITFAKEDAVAVCCVDGCVVLRLSIARLRKASRTWKDFQVRATYRPRVEGLTAELYRDGIINLSGRRLNLGSQIALRGVFARIFAKQRPLSVVPEKLAGDERLADLGVTQLRIEDGWIALALGPRREALASRSVRRRK